MTGFWRAVKGDDLLLIGLLQNVSRIGAAYWSTICRM